LKIFIRFATSESDRIAKNRLVTRVKDEKRVFNSLADIVRDLKVKVL